jgi:hypothetical protein
VDAKKHGIKNAYGQSYFNKVLHGLVFFETETESEIWDGLGCLGRLGRLGSLEFFFNYKLQLNEYETAPYFIQLIIALDCLLISGFFSVFA